MLLDIFDRMNDVLTNDFDDINIETYKKMDEDDAVTIGHHTLGRALRNEWGLWSENKLTKWFNSIGIHHADDMTAIITTSYHRQLNGKDIDLDGQVKYYQEYWEEMKKTENGKPCTIEKINGKWRVKINE